MTTMGRGARGDDVADLQRRLNDLGFLCEPDGDGTFAEGTDHALREFQKTRGLRVDGRCDDQTWNAIVESGYALGDRLLYVRRPMLRGDDIADLQHQLNALGFDSGREDGIFGDNTTGALREFQRNAGVAADGICGPATVLALGRLGTLADGSVAAVREAHAVRTDVRELPHLRIVVVAPIALAALTDRIAQRLRAEGSAVLCDTSGTEESAAAALANGFDADASVLLGVGSEPEPTCRYYGTARFRSARGEALARCLLAELPSTRAPTALASGFARETRMAAVVCELPHPLALDPTAAPALAEAVVRGIAAAFQPPA